MKAKLRQDHSQFSLFKACQNEREFIIILSSKQFGKNKKACKRLGIVAESLITLFELQLARYKRLDTVASAALCLLACLHSAHDKQTTTTQPCRS